MGETPFSELPPSARADFRLHFLAAAARLIDAAGRALGSHEALLEQSPCAAAYLDELAGLGALADEGRELDWALQLARWRGGATERLPLRALADGTNLDFEAFALWFAVGLVEEDARFGALLELLHATPGQQRPTVGLLQSWWSDPKDGLAVPRQVRALRDVGLLDVANPEAPRSQWILQVPAVLWDAARGDASSTPAEYLRHVDAAEIRSMPAPLFDASVGAELAELPPLLASGGLDAVVVRGPRHNGRRTLMRWLAHELELGVLEVTLSGKSELDQPRLRRVGPLSALLGALPVLSFELGPGETVELPKVPAAPMLGVVLGQSGGIRGAAVERAMTLNLGLPPVELRARHLALALSGAEDTTELASSFRMTSGNLVRAARLAEAHASIAGRARVAASDLRQASRALGRESLDTLATRLPDAGSWGDFAAPSDTLRELRVLERRCRSREALAGGVGAALARGLNAGVRALFQGASGTGKTLAARLLAASLAKDLYRVDLAAVVNKYIGETEKNLARVFAVAEELDVMLLFDEGDALLARRTGVSNANDRYANLETNFLLQRLESFEGIVIVTTNAGELIDGAFQRRMDAVVDFRAPEPLERWSLWQAHLPSAHHVDPSLLREVVMRCQLTGGQIRNAALYAALLALGDGGKLQSEHLEGALQREYRRSGGVCPVRIQAAGRS